jgi:hypothetical protein
MSEMTAAGNHQRHEAQKLFCRIGAAKSRCSGSQLAAEGSIACAVVVVFGG